jgi:hypothetical protein
VTCPSPAQCHTAVCDHATGLCSSPIQTDGTTCNDGNSNTVGDVCTNGVCAGVDHCIGVTCPSPAQCHTAVCDHATGSCSNPVAPDATQCDDGSACTTGDACLAGTCVGTPVVCDSSTCDPSTGLCL